jgi:hypothetical protein
MARRFQASQQKTRILVLSAAATIFGLAVWSAFTHSPREWSSAYASTSNTHAPKGFAAAIATAAYTANAPAKPDPAARCSPWDVSPVAMEAILQEMVRRGWQPPRSDVALASAQPRYGLPIEALDPDQPAWVSGVRTTAPAETGEIVDVTIDTPVIEESSRTPMPVSEPSVATPEEPAASPAPTPAETDETPAADTDSPASPKAAPTPVKP